MLHPDAVYLTSRGDVELRAAGELFMWAPYLVEALAPYQGVHIVLSTNWERNLSFHSARSVLAAEMQARVIDATWRSAMGKGWPDFIQRDMEPRFEQIKSYLSRLSAPASWIAIDDDVRGRPDVDRDRLIFTDPNCGLSTPEVLAELALKLETL